MLELLYLVCIIHALFEFEGYHYFLDKFNLNQEKYDNKIKDIFVELINCPMCLTFWISIIYTLIVGINPLWAFVAFVAQKYLVTKL